MPHYLQAVRVTCTNVHICMTGILQEKMLVLDLSQMAYIFRTAILLLNQIMVDDQPYLTFKSTGCEAFTAMSYSPSDSMIVGVKGGSYVSEANGKVEIIVPQDCFEDNTTIGIKVQFQTH